MNVIRSLFIFFLSLIFGCLHGCYVYKLFENSYTFLNLSDLEQEMTFRGSMAMYYSHYKILVEPNNFYYEYFPKSAQKYSTLPEVAISYLYRVVQYFYKQFLEKHIEIDRMNFVMAMKESADLITPVSFYIKMVGIMQFFTVTILFYYAVHLNDSILSGIIAIILFCGNLTDSMYLHRSSQLRENFAYPVLLFQMYCVSMMIKKFVNDNLDNKSLLTLFCSKSRMILLIVSTICSTLCSMCIWQFSQFIFGTQILILLILKWWRIIPGSLCTIIMMCHIIAIMLSSLSIYTNSNLIFSSYYMWIVIAYIFTLGFIHNMGLISQDDNVTRTLDIVIVIIAILFKMSIMHGDTYIFHIMRSKLTNYKDFCTMLYTCFEEFYFLKSDTFHRFCYTSLFNVVIFSGIIIMYYWYKNFKTIGYPRCIEACLAYNIIQTIVFTIMAALVMKLKILMTPHLCIIAGIVASKRYLINLSITSKLGRYIFIAFVISVLIYPAGLQLKREYDFRDEYPDAAQKELFEWIIQNTSKHASFAGKMSLMPNIMLSTGRQIVNNPDYESEDMRNVNIKVYHIFSRENPDKVYFTLHDLRVNYIVLDKPSCFGILTHLPEECQLINIWDLVKSESKTRKQLPLCPRLFNNEEDMFERVFYNEYYTVLKLEYSNHPKRLGLS